MDGPSNYVINLPLPSVDSDFKGDQQWSLILALFENVTNLKEIKPKLSSLNICLIDPSLVSILWLVLII